MGKYMRRKSKTTGEVSLMEVPSLGGVLTRAKALALQKAAAVSYIQLRSRRLVKPTAKNPERCVITNPSKLRGVNSLRREVNSEEAVMELGDDVEKRREETEIKGAVDGFDDEDEASFGENMVEIEGRGRTTRETTPCNLIRDPDAIRTPGSSTKPARSIDGKYRVQNTTLRRIPSTTEMDEFFTEPEKQQQRQFIEKYNFDPVNDKPLQGRYEWVKIDAIKKS